MRWDPEQGHQNSKNNRNRPKFNLFYPVIVGVNTCFLGIFKRSSRMSQTILLYMRFLVQPVDNIVHPKVVAPSVRKTSVAWSIARCLFLVLLCFQSLFPVVPIFTKFGKNTRQYISTNCWFIKYICGSTLRNLSTGARKLPGSIEILIK